MCTDNDNNETDLEKEYEEAGGVSHTAMKTVMEINNKIEFLNEKLEKKEKKNYKKTQLEREEKLKIEQLEKEEKLHLENMSNSKGSLTETCYLKGWR